MRFHQFIQVAGVIDQEEAELLCNCGVKFLGFPLRLPVHREDLSELAARSIIHSLPLSCEGILITYLDDAEEIISLSDFLGTRLVQLHGKVSLSALARIKRLRPDLVIIKSLIVGLGPTDELVADVNSFSPCVDAFLTDTYDPASGAWGATGSCHNWSVSLRLVRASARPLILAGGLNPENVGAAISRVHPAGVDAHTGLEDAQGRKCPRKVKSFVAEAMRGFAAMDPNP